MARMQWTALLVAVGCVAGSARAEVVATYTGLSPVPTEVVNTAGTRPNGTTLNLGNFNNGVGAYTFTVQSDGGLGLGSSFRSFCAEYFSPVGNANIGDTVRFNPVSVAALPDVGGNATRVAKIQELYDRFYDLSSSKVGAAAFQLALWEILYDTNANNLASGNFRVTPSGTVTSPALAQLWLNTINSSSVPNVAKKYELIGLQSDTFQDQITVVNPVPAPAGVVLLLVGAGALVVRRRMAAKKLATADLPQA